MHKKWKKRGAGGEDEQTELAKGHQRCWNNRVEIGEGKKARPPLLEAGSGLSHNVEFHHV